MNRFLVLLDCNCLERSDSGVGTRWGPGLLQATCLDVALGKFRKVSTANMKEFVSACDSFVDVQQVCLAVTREYKEATQNTKDTGDRVFAKKERKTWQGRDSLMGSKTVTVTETELRALPSLRRGRATF